MKLDRKLLVMSIAGGVAVVLTILVLLLFMWRSGNTSEEPIPTPTIIAPTPEPEPTEPGFEPDPSTGAPEGAFENDYSNDEGYQKLPADYEAPENPEGSETVWDEWWAVEKTTKLICELSTKQTVTQRALQPLVDWADDLGRANHPNATGLQAQARTVIAAYTPHMDKPVPANARAKANMYCTEMYEED